MNLIRVVETVHEIFVVIFRVKKLETLRLVWGESVVIFRVGKLETVVLFSL